MKTLESRRFVATPADIEALARGMLAADTQAASGRGTYLKALVATTQVGLGAEVRKRASTQAPKLKADEISIHLSALEAVHERFYEAVVKAVKEELPRDPDELNRRTNFARSAKSKLRGWIKAGNDIRALAAVRVTHAALAVEASPKALTPKRLLRATEKAAERLVSAAEAQIAQDKEGALAALEAAATRLTAALVTLGATPVRDAAQAIREHRPFRSGGGMFFPVPKAANDERVRLAA